MSFFPLLFHMPRCLSPAQSRTLPTNIILLLQMVNCKFRCSAHPIYPTVLPSFQAAPAMQDDSLHFVGLSSHKNLCTEVFLLFFTPVSIAKFEKLARFRAFKTQLFYTRMLFFLCWKGNGFMQNTLRCFDGVFQRVKHEKESTGHVFIEIRDLILPNEI